MPGHLLEQGHLEGRGRRWEPGVPKSPCPHVPPCRSRLQGRVSARLPGASGCEGRRLCSGSLHGAWLGYLYLRRGSVEAADLGVSRISFISTPSWEARSLGSPRAGTERSSTTRSRARLWGQQQDPALLMGRRQLPASYTASGKVPALLQEP